MPAIPILSGIYANGSPDFRTAYPVNMVPVPMATGISEAYLRPADGLVSLGVLGPGIGRGGINWNGALYRVMGPFLVRIDPLGNVTTIGNVGDDGKPVTFDYSFDQMCIASCGNLYYSNGTTLVQNVDPDLGTVVDVVWVDGYFFTTDGEFLVVTELNDPLAVNPLKYASSEADPDAVVALLKVRNEVGVLNRFTIEVFDNVGGVGFPFQRIEGAQIMKGCVGTHACCIYQEAMAFLGGGRNEAPGVYVGVNATAQKVSSREVDEILATFTEAQLATAVLEARNDRGHELLYVHLPDRTLVFDGAASKALGGAVWFVLTSSLQGLAQYRARWFVYAYDGWQVCDTATPAFGRTTQDVSTHWGDRVRWEFSTPIVYNESKGAIFNALELVALPGAPAFGVSPVVSTDYSLDGVTWSIPHTIGVGTLGQRTKRIEWRRQGSMRNWRIQRFRGDSQAHLPVARLEADLEPLAW
jgi:hypothetical protein